MIEKLIFALEIIGTIAFAVSGAMVALEKKMDLLGVAVLGLTTAVGGGIIRDVLLGITPPMAFRRPVYALTAIIVSLIVFIPAVRKRIDLNGNLLLIMDSLGLGIFTVIGVRAGIPFNNTFLAIFVGAMTGVGGGVLRDVFAGERPYIFVHHFYACASLIGAAVCKYLWGLNETLAIAFGALTVLALRLLAAKLRWSLPKPK